MARTRRNHRINPQAHSQRTALRLLGGILVAVGGIFTLVGLTSFFSSFGSFESPDKFWCAFVGLPMLGFGVMLLKLGPRRLWRVLAAATTTTRTRASAINAAMRWMRRTPVRTAPRSIRQTSSSVAPAARACARPSQRAFAQHHFALAWHLTAAIA